MGANARAGLAPACAFPRADAGGLWHAPAVDSPARLAHPKRQRQTASSRRAAGGPRLFVLCVSLALTAVATPLAARAQGASTRAATPRAQRPDPAPTLESLIAAAVAGGSDASVDAALDALRERGDERASEALVSLTTHRRVGARRRAYLALAALRGERARDAVSKGLSDIDGGIRSLCARALGEMGAREALPRLFLALERGVHDAARSIGALADEEQLPRFHAQLGRVPLGPMLEGYGRLVRRTDVSWAAKQDILHRLFEVSGLEVRGFLVQWHRELPTSAPEGLRADLERSIRRIPLRPRSRALVAPSSAPEAPPVTPQGAQ